MIANYGSSESLELYLRPLDSQSFHLSVRLHNHRRGESVGGNVVASAHADAVHLKDIHEEESHRIIQVEGKPVR